MKRNEVFNKLLEILCDSRFLLDEDIVDTINEDTSFLNDLVFDSIQILELLVSVEEEFNITCETEDLNVELFNTVGSLVDFIEGKLA